MSSDVFNDFNTVIGILALYGAWYGMYRYFAYNSAAYLAAHEVIHQEILGQAMACANTTIRYVEPDPQGGYALTALGRTADQAEIEACQDSLRALTDKIGARLLESPGPWRFRFAARWKFYGNVRQWLQIRRDCQSISLRLSGDRSSADMLQH